MRSLRLFLIVFLLSGCQPDVDGPALHVFGDSLDTPATYEEHGLVEFGDVLVGEVAVRTITVRNGGDDTLALNTAELDAPSDVTLLNLDALPSVLEPGEQWGLEIEYRPTTDSSLDGAVTLFAATPWLPPREVDLRGEGLGPGEVHYSAGASVGTQVSCSSVYEFSVFNHGRADLVIESISALVDSSPDELVLEGIAEGMIAPPEGRFDIAMTYAPVDLGEDTAEWLVTLNGGVVNIDMAVEGEPAEPRTDSFAASVPPLDILWVVHPGPGTAEARAGLQAAAADYLHALQAAGLDFQIGVISTDIGLDGVLQGPLVHSGLSDPASVFEANLDVPSSDAPDQGLDAIVRAFAPQHTNSGGANEGILRSGADLQIILVSSRDDTSVLLVEPAAYVGYVNGSAERWATFNDLTGGTAGCSGPAGAAAPAPTYAAISEGTKGRSAALCDGDWSGLLGDLVFDSVVPSEVFLLDRPAQPDTIEVFVVPNGGQAVAVGGWAYDPVDSAIVFDSGPPPGSVLTVDYLTGCPAQ